MLKDIEVSSNAKLFSVSKNVEFCETDMAGIAHFSNIFRYVEYAETRFFQQGGMSICDPAKDQKWPILSVNCDFLRPMTFGDEILIAINVGRIGTKSLVLNFFICKKLSDGREEDVSRGQLTVIHAKASGEHGKIATAEIPPDFKSYLREYLAAVDCDEITAG
ncbi:thioesterase family protein [Pseudovibrio sp. POLY-S9]|uniref:acyl-CoA thioesterase n=1 Tax=Pseudovibrio sp. POLY-S9 TaxID=1576596 RepID=UPI00070B8538|nr:thioesterase family protein [Pseudovibrio sp. POLY-S9]